MAEKIFIRAAANLFFYRFFGDSLFSSLVSFSFFDSCFFRLFVCLMLFRIKNAYSDTHSTMGPWNDEKIFTRPISGNKDYFF